MVKTGRNIPVERTGKEGNPLEEVNVTKMEIAINPDLLTVMLLYSLPASFENFRCAIESRDNLPTPETLRTKIIEESDARKNDPQNVCSDAT